MAGLNSRRDSVTTCDKSQPVTAGAGLTCDKTGVTATGPTRLSRSPVVSGMPGLSAGQVEALRKYSKDAERSVTSRDPDRAAEARQSFGATRRAVGAKGVALLDLIIIRGRGLADVARLSGQSVVSLGELLVTAAEALATHYELGEVGHG